MLQIKYKKDGKRRKELVGMAYEAEVYHVAVFIRF